MVVGGVRDVAWSSPGAPAHRVRRGGIVGHSSSSSSSSQTTGGAGAVGLALVGGARLPSRPAGGAQGRVAQAAPCLGI